MGLKEWYGTLRSPCIKLPFSIVHHSLIFLQPSVKLMVCGMDTYHEGAQKSNSVSAFVASMNESFTRWYSKVALQNKGQEIIDELKLMFSSCLKQFHRVSVISTVVVVVYHEV